MAYLDVFVVITINFWTPTATNVFLWFVYVHQSPEEKVVAIGLADGRTIVHNIVYDQTILTVKQDWGEVMAISFRTG